jgi:hypothetical protein
METIDPDAIAIELVKSKGFRKYIVTVKENVINARVTLLINPEDKIDPNEWQGCTWREWRDNCPDPHDRPHLHKLYNR